jgi:hypothetical protein
VADDSDDILRQLDRLALAELKMRQRAIRRAARRREAN